MIFKRNEQKLNSRKKKISRSERGIQQRYDLSKFHELHRFCPNRQKKKTEEKKNPFLLNVFFFKAAQQNSPDDVILYISF